MAGSLLTFFPQIGRVLGETPDALYAYQRAFVRAGILDTVAGRGRGSGVRASPQTIAQFIIGLLTHASIADNVGHARALANAAAAKRSCPFTGAANFEDALAALLANEKLADRVNEIVVGTTLAQAFVRYDGSPQSVAPGSPGYRDFESSVFVGKAAKSAALSFSASVSADTVRKLAKLVATEIGGEG